MDFKRRLKELRAKKGLSQSQLAKKLGISKSSISMYEVGSREPDFETLEIIADFFNVDIDYLLGKKELSTYIITPEEREVLEAVAGDPSLMRLLHYAVAISDKEQLERLINLLEGMGGR